MTDQEDEIDLGTLVFDDNNQERKSWACLGRTCSRFLIVLLSHLFVALLITFRCYRKIHLSKTSDQSIVWIVSFCSAAGYNLPTRRL